MPYLTFGYRLPYFLSRVLFGDRRRFGLAVKPDDPVWREWLEISYKNYTKNKDRPVVSFVDDSGYRIMESVDLSGKRVLEMGPGVIPHLPWWRGEPGCYVIGDVRQAMLDGSAEKLRARQIPVETRLLSRTGSLGLPFESGEFDAIVSFYSLEHLYPLETYLEEMIRVLKPGGTLVGAIPCEGGLAWGLGRTLTTRRWMKKEYPSVPLDHIICWEHPNFADLILRTLDRRMKQNYLKFWPLGVPSIDLNLTARFIYEKK